MNSLLDAGGPQVLVEPLVVVLSFLSRSDPLLGSAIVPGVGIDRDHLGVRKSCARQDDRRSTAVAADLDDRPTRRDSSGSVPQTPRLVLGHPPLDISDRTHDGTKGRAV